MIFESSHSRMHIKEDLYKMMHMQGCERQSGEQLSSVNLSHTFLYSLVAKLFVLGTIRQQMPPL